MSAAKSIGIQISKLHKGGGGAVKKLIALISGNTCSLNGCVLRKEFDDFLIALIDRNVF